MRFEPTELDRNTYDAVFDHTAESHLNRCAVVDMLARFAEASQVVEGGVTFTRNGRTLVLRVGGIGGHTYFAEEDLMNIRHFLQRAGAHAKGTIAPGAHFLVAFDERAARVYEVRLQGGVPRSITRYDPHEFAGHLRFDGEADADDIRSSGRRQFQRGTFCEAVSRTLCGADRVVLAFGIGGAARWAVNELLAELRLHYIDLAGRVAGVIAIGDANPTDARLLAAVREFYVRRQN